MENETLNTLKTRRSVRAFADTPIEQEKIEAIVEAATYAPTGMGAQSPTIVVIKDKETRDKVSALNAGVMGRDMDPFYGAPVVAVVFGDKDVAPTWLEDACHVAVNLLNAALSVGVDSCYIWRAQQSFETEEGRALMKEWGLPDSCVGVANCALGYGDGPAPEPAPRKEGYVKVV